MNKKEKLRQMELLWKSKERDIPWDDLRWDPVMPVGNPLEVPLAVEIVIDAVNNLGRIFYSWGFAEEKAGRTWNSSLLYSLQIWYSIPDTYEIPMFVNETARVICFPAPEYADRFALLFQCPNSMLLGMEHLDDEKEAQDAAAVSHGTSKLTKPQVGCSFDLSKTEATK